LNFFVTQSFAKNFGLYGERIGALHVVCSNESLAKIVLSQLKLVIRPLYSSPPKHGAHLVHIILSSPELFSLWKTEVKMMADRIKVMRQALFDSIQSQKTPGDWTHVLKQIGMFSYTGLSNKQVDIMINKHHIYLTSDGRISMAGVNMKNVGYIAAAIHDVVVNSPEIKSKI